MRRFALAGLLLCLILSGCGLYGEKGFTGTNPVSAKRFVREIDEECQDVNEELDEETAALLGANPGTGEAADDAIGDLRDGIDALVEDLDGYFGPEDLEAVRDDYIEALERADDELEAAKKALDGDDGETAFRAELAKALATLDGAEEELRAAGFRVCGTPRPVPED